MNSMNDLLKEYKMNEDIPEDIKKKFHKNKRKNLIKIYKKIGKYNSKVGVTLFVYFAFKNLGITLTLYQSFVVFISTSIITAGLITGGTYTAVKHFKEKSKVIEIKEDKETGPTEKDSIIELKKDNNVDDKNIKKIKTIANKKLGKPVVKPDYSKVENKIILSPDSITGDVDNNILKLVNSNIKKELNFRRGPDNIVTNSSKGGSIYELIGSVDKFNNIYTIFIRIFDRRTSQIIFGTTGEFSSKNKIKDVCKKIVRELSRKVK